MSKVPLLVIVLAGGHAAASPAACIKSPKDMTREAKVIVVATPLTSKLTILQDSRTRRAEYAVSAVIRGAKMKKIVIEASCSHEQVPERLAGYPSVHRYCAYNNLAFPGFELLRDKPTTKSEVVLFVTESSRLVDRTGYLSCDATPWPPTTAETIKLVKQLVGVSR